MPRVLITFAGVSERRVATRRAARLARRGVDVDLACRAVAGTLVGRRYDRVLDVASGDLDWATAADPAVAKGTLRIVGAADADEPAPAMEPVGRSPRLWAIPAAITVAIATALAIRGLDAPVLYQVLLGALTATAAVSLFRVRSVAPAAPHETFFGSSLAPEPLRPSRTA